MKLCRYDADKLGLVLGDQVIDVTDLRDAVVPKDWTGTGDATIAHLAPLVARIKAEAGNRKGVPLAGVKLLSPVKSPTKLPAAPTNYRAHIAEMQKVSANNPVKRSSDIGTSGMFLKATSSMVGPSEGIQLRFLDRRNDHEVELAIVIGKTCNAVAQADALDYVAGYCIGLDITLRGPEDRSFRKSIDTYSVLGPWMVTADEIPDPDALQLKIAVNGEGKQNANTRDMVYSVRRLIEFSSAFYTLHPGDVIYTGTPEGVSQIKPGDVLTAEVERIGKMDVRVR
ncbi:MAG TPA: fumarylacetoacetate hydrolase family protein [Alphaproteobacteria bacterium]|nr:fumarylacetoacetate hydrolase family protein [Alphaproteobacteria bacterium]